jgi:hypothetical protein
MKHFSFARVVPALGLAISIQLQLHAQDHGHLNVGALGTNQDTQLYFANGSDFIASSGYVKTLDYTNAGRFAGYYQGNITLTALPTTAAHAGPDPNASAPGSFLQFSMACLEGPAGGSFNFWDAGTTAPSLSLAPGQTSTQLWRLSENDGSPGSDPFGHIHGRRFSATKPGLYKIGFTAVDTSTNGAERGPIHTPSAQLPVWFQAGVNVLSVEPDEEEGHVHLKFGGRLGYSWQVEASETLGPSADWQPAGRPVVGADVFIEVIHDGAPGEQRFYRVKGTPIIP